MASYDGSLIFDTKIDKSGFKKGSASLKSIATKSAAAVGAALAAGIGATIKLGIGFESAFAGVKKTVDATDFELALLRKGIRAMALEIPPSAAGIAGIAESAGQLGIQTKNILKFSRTMADLGVATNLTGEEAATTLAKFANITQMPQENFDRLGSTIVAMGNNLATTEADIAAMALRLAGAGKQIGLTEAQTLAFAGALSSVGIEAEAGGSAFSKMMADMQLAVETGSSDLKDFAKVAGMSADEFKQAFKKDAAGAIIAFIKGLGESKQRGTSAIKVLDDMSIKEARLRDALLRASGASNVFSDAISLGTKAWGENTALTKEAEQRYATLASRLSIFKNSAVDLGITIYDSVQKPIADAVNTGTDKISELAYSLKDGELKPALDNVGGLLGRVTDSTINLATGAIPVLVGGLSTISMGMNVLFPIATMAAGGIAAYKVSIATATAAQAAFNTAVNLNPVGLAIAGIAAAGVGIYQIAAACREAETAYYNFGDSIAAAGDKFDEAKQKASLTEEHTKQWYALKDAIASGTLPADELAAAEQRVQELEQWFIDNYGNFISAEEEKNGIRAETLGLIKQQADALSETQRLELESQLLEKKSNVPNMIEEVKKLQEKNIKLEEQRKTALENRIALQTMRNEYEAFLNTNPSDSEINEYLSEMSQRVEDLTGTGLSGAGFADLDQRIIDFGNNADKAADKIEKNNQKMADGKESLQQYADGAQRIIELQLGSSYEQAAGNLELLKSAQDEFNKTGGVSKEKLDDLIKAFPDLANAKDKPEQITQKMGELERKMEDAKAKARELGTDLNGLPKNLDINVNLKVNGAGSAPGFAKGTSFANRGLSVVNELGTELIEGRDGSFRYVDTNSAALTYLNKGDKVYTAQQTRGMFQKEKRLPGFAGGLNNAGASIGFAANISGKIGASSYHVGKTIDLALAAGIQDYSGEVVASVTDLGRKLANATQEYNDRLTEITAERRVEEEASARVSYEEKLSKAKDAAEKQKIIAEEEKRIKKKNDDEILENLKENLTAQEKARDDAFRNLKYMLEVGAITEEQYYTNLEVLRDSYFAKGSDEWRQYTLSILNYQKSQVKAAYDDIAKYVDETVGAVTDAQSKMEGKLRGIGGLTQTVKITGLDNLTEFTELADLDAQNKVMEDYVSSMTALRDKLTASGADERTVKGIMSELADMSIADANKALRAFNHAPDSKLTHYTEAYAKKQALSESLSAGYYQKDYETAVDKSIQYAEDKLKDFGFDVPAGFFTTGSKSAEQFGTAFVEELDKQMAEIRKKINTFNSSLFYSFSAAAGVPNFGGTTYSHSATYNLLNSGATAEAGIAAAKRQEVIDRQRNA